jgi:hypothetical protein
MTVRKVITAFFVTVLALSGPFVGRAAACTCMRSSCGDLAKAGLVFEATVSSIENTSRDPATPERKLVRLRDVRALIGRPPVSVTTASSSASCGYEFEEGIRYLIVTHHTSADSVISVSHCSLTRPLSEARGLVSYIESLPQPADGELGQGRYHVSAQAVGRPELLDMKSQEIVLDSARDCGMLDFVAFVDGRIHGRVIDKEGRGLAKMFVELMPAGAVDPSTAVAGMGSTSDEDGRDEFSKLPPGRYMVGIDIWLRRSPSATASYATADGASRVIVLQNGQHLQAYPIVIAPPH